MRVIANAAEVHDPSFARQCAEGKAIADGLAPRRHVGFEAKLGVGARFSCAEARHHFVEDENTAVLAGNALDLTDRPGRIGDGILGLGDDAGHLARMGR